MKKIFFILIILVFVTGCASSSRFRGTERVFGGYADGVTIEFLSPTEKPDGYHVREEIPFNVRVNLENNAECDVDGELKLWDLTSIDGVPPDSTQHFSLMAREYGDEPDSIKLNFDGNEYPNLDEYVASTTLIATAVYDCNIRIDPQICLKADDTKYIKDCENTETISGRKEGLKTAPVTVEKIIKFYDPDSNLLTAALYLNKMGGNNGKIVSESQSANKEEHYGVNIMVRYGGDYLECDEIKDGFYLWDEETENIINCEIQLSSIDEVEKGPLIIDMDYKFEITETMEIKIKQSKNTLE